MKFLLKRGDYERTGIFGVLSSDDLPEIVDVPSAFICQTLEHAYPVETPVGYAPKVPLGVYTCVRGIHQLEKMTHSFETFQVMNVPGHTNILFHSGNVNADSAGCILLGLKNDNDKEILESRIAFQLFMSRLEGQNSFELTVE